MKQYIRTVNECVEYKKIYGQIRGYAQFWAGKQFVCTCKGFQYNKHCKHLRNSVKNFVIGRNLIQAMNN